MTVLILAWEPARSMVGLSGMEPSYRAGDRIDLGFAGAPRARRTVLVFSRADCAACIRSKPEFASLSAALGARNVRLVLVIHGGATPPAVAFGRDIGIPAEHVVALESTPLHILRVPALAVVDEQGRILVYSEGVPSAEAQDRILKAAS